jgi:8-amino-7-oxononanoate synthase
MDGDCPNLELRISDKHHCYLVVDESHALGVFGSKGEGFVQMLGLQDLIFARILTFEMVRMSGSADFRFAGIETILG